MRIGFDATSLCRRITGIESYTLNLAKALLSMDGPHAFVVYFRSEIHPELAPLADRAAFRVCRARNQVFCEQAWLPWAVRSEKLDVVHYPAFPPAAVCPRPFVMTIYDGTLWRDPRGLSWKARLYMKPLTSLAAGRAARVLTISEFSRREIDVLTAAPPDRILNAGIAVGGDFAPAPAEAAAVQAKYRLPARFILFVGTLEPRKNIGALLEAYARFRRAGGADWKLVIAGRRGWGAVPVNPALRDMGLERDVFTTGYVDAADLPALYSLAGVFVFPSLYEGFGLPPLEAMACGTPVVCSNRASLPEAVADAGLLVDPTDPEALAGAIGAVLSDEALRARLRAAGLRRAAQLSWDAVARAAVAAYETAAGGAR